ncbi:MAG: MiaB-like tRNA modifying enzyme YliG [Clostridiales bacterium]|jgi:ribosomal protein S12 methylthiotransferase|nr:MiaB-like tRNA modifying enzyme YliG [Clostridiales bacterium]
MKVFFASLGCDKNLVDTEVMLGKLIENGHSITNNEIEADVIVVNTCCFIHDAKEESINTILEMAEYKKTGVCKALIVTGCLAERYKEDITKEIEEVDALFGTTSYGDIISVLEEVLKGNKHTLFRDIDYSPEPYNNRVNTTGGYSTYIKIAEGCDKHCTYCIIPSLRGKFRSVPMEVVLEEAQILAQKGIKELILVAQDTSAYGIDIYDRFALPELLTKMCQIKELDWIRVLYCYPEQITDELIEVMKNEPKICKYIDIPIQHASDEILRKMGRRTSQDELRTVINKLRTNIPGIAIRTTLITGFPGETQEEHIECVKFVEEMKFERLGVFTYSKEPGTPAAKLKNQVPEKTKKSRRDVIMALQQEIVFKHNVEMEGKLVDVLIEGKIPEENVYVGRTYMDAPNVDGYIFVNSPEEMISGDIVKVKVSYAKEYDLIGDRVYEYSK